MSSTPNLPIVEIATLAALKLISVTVSTQLPIIYLQGAVTQGDGQEGYFISSIASTIADNTATGNFSVVNPTGNMGAGRWLRIGAVPSKGLLQSFSSATVWDTFDAPDANLVGRVVPTANSTWDTLGGNPKIVSKRLTTTNNCYPILQFPDSEVFNFIAGTFVYSQVSPSFLMAQANLTLIMSADGTLANNIHLVFGPTGWNLSKFVAGVITQVGSASYPQVPVDGTSVNLMAMSRDGDTVTVYAPGQSPVDVTDADFATLDPLYGIWQCEPDGGPGPYGEWESICMGGELIADKLIPLGGAAPMGTVNALQGAPGTGKALNNRFAAIAAGGGNVGWYRIATGYPQSAFVISGLVSLTLSTQFTYQILSFNIAATQTGGAQFAQTQQMGATIVDQVRLTWDGSANVAIDIHVVDASADIALTINYEGIFTPADYGTIVVGATAYANTQVSAVSAPISPYVVSFGGSIGWYRIATETGSWQGFGLGGQIGLLLQSTDGPQILDMAVGTDTLGATNFQQNLNTGRTPLLDGVRLSWNTGSNLAAMDVHLAYAVTVQLTGDFFGDFTLNYSPTVGATALTTGNTVYTLKPQSLVLPMLATSDPHILGAMWSNSGVATISAG